MVWGKTAARWAVLTLSVASGCTPQARAACVPRLELSLRAHENLGERTRGIAVVHQQRWDVTLHARLRWRAQSRRWP